MGIGGGANPLPFGVGFTPGVRVLVGGVGVGGGGGVAWAYFTRILKLNTLTLTYT